MREKKLCVDVDDKVLLFCWLVDVQEEKVLQLENCSGTVGGCGGRVGGASSREAGPHLAADQRLSGATSRLM